MQLNLPPVGTMRCSLRHCENKSTTLHQPRPIQKHPDSLSDYKPLHPHTPLKDLLSATRNSDPFEHIHPAQTFIRTDHVFPKPCGGSDSSGRQGGRSASRFCQGPDQNPRPRLPQASQPWQTARQQICEQGPHSQKIPPRRWPRKRKPSSSRFRVPLPHGWLLAKGPTTDAGRSCLLV